MVALIRECKCSNEEKLAPFLRGSKETVTIVEVSYYNNDLTTDNLYLKNLSGHCCTFC